MKKQKAIKTAISTGLTSVVIYLGCYLIILIMGRHSIVKLSNYLFHGVDFTSIIRTDIPFLETLLGAVISFVFWGFVGLVFSLFYNKLNR